MASPAGTARVRVEEGGIDDLDPVMKVMNAAFGTTYGEAWTKSQCAGILPMAGVRLEVARDEAEIIGFALSRTVVDDSELLLLAVLPDWHRRGIGQQLLDRFVESARQSGVTRVHLEVRDGNPAIAMYRQSGFAPAGRRLKYYRGSDGRRYDALTFVRGL
jgi:ribosomal-protein-alanine N-acetyltransferase